MSNPSVDLAKALYEQEATDHEVRKRLVAGGLSVRSAADAMWRARRALKLRPDGTIATGPAQLRGADWNYLEDVVHPAEADFLAALRANERPPANLCFDESSVPLRIGAFTA